MKREGNNLLTQALSQIVDKMLHPLGFTRGKHSLVYKRVLAEADQRIVFVVDWHPQYQPGADAHIHPHLQLRIKRISNEAIALAAGNATVLGGHPEVILNQPIEFVAPKPEVRRWFATGKQEFSDACVEIAAFLIRWVIPFLNQASRTEDIIRLYETIDKRVFAQRPWYVYVAAAYKVLDRISDAQHVLLTQFNSVGLRTLYAQVFKSLGVE